MDTPKTETSSVEVRQAIPVESEDDTVPTTAQWKEHFTKAPLGWHLLLFIFGLTSFLPSVYGLLANDER